MNLIIPILRTLSVLITLILTVVWLTPTFPRCNIFAKRAGKALETLYAMEQETQWETQDGHMKTIPTGLISDEQTGFEWVRRAVVRNRPEVKSGERRHGEIEKIGLAMGDSEINYNGAFGAIIPGNFAYAEFNDGEIVPFIKDEQEQRVISTWTNREVERSTGSIVVGLIFLWALVSLLLVWIPSML